MLFPSPFISTSSSQPYLSLIYRQGDLGGVVIYETGSAVALNAGLALLDWVHAIAPTIHTSMVGIPVSTTRHMGRYVLLIEDRSETLEYVQGTIEGSLITRPTHVHWACPSRCTRAPPTSGKKCAKVWLYEWPMKVE